LALVGAAAAVATIALLAVGARMRCAGSLVVTTAGPAGDIFDDLPPLRALRAHPWQLCATVAGGVAIAMTLVAWHAEQSLAEGLQRGIVEGLAATAGFVVLGRAIGARS
ncbi:MAG TPA: hypothetical protein VGF63_05010, partial [Solirubrobacteraceae bacterium]